ncbi:FlgL Flagellin and related hook-associated proteins [Oxalobacteraceae bacterium]
MSVINTNLNALVSQESSRASNLKLSRSMERLSTGSRINSAKDDAAGLAITNRMTSQVRGIQMAVKNSNDAISMSQTAEGAYGQVGNILQRMRELAVQSASGTVTASDRSSIQLEVDQLKEEINHIADTTNFNNIKLLDGTAKNVVIQTGADQADTIKMSFDSVRANHMGSDIQPSLTSAGGTAAARAALADGDLMINGVQIGVSYSDDDKLSSADQAASAIAKAAAINRMSDSTGVIAKAATNTVSGSAMTGAALSGNIVINGYTTANVSTTTDTSLSRQLVTDAINAISGATGVKAINTDSDNAGIALVAEDGRNIRLATSTVTAASTGLATATATTYVGSFHLYSKDGSDISIDSKEDVVTSSTTAGITKAGLRVGTYEGRSASTVTAMRATTEENTATASTGTVADLAGKLNGDTLVINGIAIGASVGTDDVFSYQTSGSTAVGSQRSQSAIAIAAAINKQTERTGVTATAQANVLRGTGFTASTSPVSSASITLNGVSFTTDTTDIQNVVDSFNEVAGQTGVTARVYGSSLELRAEDGRNIAIASTNGGVAALGLTSLTVGASSSSAITFYSTVKLASDEAFTVESGYEGVANFELLGFRRGTYGGAVGDKVSEIDLTTQQGASDAIRALDAAINQVSAAQAMSGAQNNRLDVIVNNLSEGLQNISASRSRILDTDYATETTELAKQQIIQQAATAMLAQANQQPQGVLALLK